MKIYAMVEYINKNGMISIKGFASEETLQKFVARLDSRKAEYIVTIL